MYIRYIVFTKYIRFIYLLKTIDMSVLQKFTTLQSLDKYIFCLASIDAIKTNKRLSCIKRK